MARQRKGRSHDLAPDWQELWARLPKWPWKPKPIHRQALGVALLILALLTLLGLAGVSTGAVLGWWVQALEKLFGWAAYPVAIALGFWGLWQSWEELRARVPIYIDSIIVLEILFLIVLTASHIPSILRTGVDEAWVFADQGQGGGYIGWALGLLLIEGLGPVVGSAILLLVLLFSVFWLLDISIADLWSWTQHYARRLAAVFDRWWIARQGTAIEPDPPEEPWWEQDVPESPTRKRKSKSTSAKKQKRPKPRVEDGSLPSFDLLDPSSPKSYGDTDVRRKAKLIEDTLESFGVPVQVIEVNHGPTVTQFGLDPGYIERRVSGGEVQRQRVRVNKISRLAKDLELALAASPIRIEAPVPGRSIVGMEVPNDTVSLVSLRSVMESKEFYQINSPLAIALGENVSGRPIAVDLGLMPHLLIAGATGSGKSVCLNTVVCCLLFNNRPSDLQVMMIDPKMVELVGYNDIPHLLAPVVVDVEQVVGALAWITREMDERYQKFHKTGSRNLEQYNKYAAKTESQQPLPKLLVFIDELADLMMVAPDEVERHLCRVAQMGRATGIHLVIATQRPSVDVVTGLIKANFPARISFAVTSQVDSRVILDQSGAENLLGRGDMLFMSPQQAAPIRLQGCFVSDPEIRRLTDFWREQTAEEQEPSRVPPWAGLVLEEETDDLLSEAIALAEQQDRISTSYVQRKLHVGFPRAARIMDELEDRGLVGPDEGGGRGREVLIGKAVDLDEIDERLPGTEPS